MTDSGQPAGTPPNSQTPGIPPWAPTPQEAASEDAPRPAAKPPVPAPPASNPPAPPTPVPYISDVSATMRLIPVPSPSTPPPPIPVMAPTPSPTTDRYIGKYRVKGELGRGGMGAVYLAEQPGLGREVAIKELIPSAAADPIALKRFLQEAQVMARTSHPNLVQVHDLELAGDANYIVLQFVTGLAQPGPDPPTAGLRRHARRASGARLCAQARDRAPGHEA